jgi:hypothetical protein
MCNNFTNIHLFINYINFITWFQPFQSLNLREVTLSINIDYKFSEVPGPGQYK